MRYCFVYLFVLLFSVPALCDNATTNTAPAGTSTVVQNDSLTAKEIVQDAATAYASLSGYSSAGESITTIGSTTLSNIGFSIRLQRPNLYRIDWKAASSDATKTNCVWSNGTGDFLDLFGTTQKMKDRMMALASATGVSGRAAAIVPGAFFQDNWGNILNPNLPVEKQPDETVDNVKCYVVSSTVSSHSGTKVVTTLWIGQADKLIHQVRTIKDRTEMPTITNQQIEDSLKQQGQPVTQETINAMKTSITESAAKLIQSGPVTFTQTERNIVVNPTFSPSDFSP